MQTVHTLAPYSKIKWTTNTPCISCLREVDTDGNYSVGYLIGECGGWLTVTPNKRFPLTMSVYMGASLDTELTITHHKVLAYKEALYKLKIYCKTV